jgi:hypothetical protein
MTERLGRAAAKGTDIGQIQKALHSRQEEREKLPELTKERVRPFEIGL